MNIEGTFDNTSFISIKRAVKEYGIDETICHWVDDMLRNRNVQTSLENSSAEAVVVRGCPQGSAFTPYLHW